MLAVCPSYDMNVFVVLAVSRLTWNGGRYP